MKRKGFTLIELIVVMAIIAILVFIAAPKFLEYIDDAEVTKIKTNIKELETASATYIMRRNELPILAGETLTSEQIQGETYDKTGVVEEVLDGTYSNIDYFKIKNYLKAPKESEKYILHESGKVYYLSSGVSLAESMEDYFLVTPEGVLTGLSETYKALGNEAPKDLVIPQVINGITVTSIGDGAFYRMSEMVYPEDPMDEPIYIDPIEMSITSVKLPNTIISIGDNAFNSVKALTEILIPESVTTIGKSAFYNCISLKTITLPDNLITIGGYAFTNCIALENIIIPDKVTIIETATFLHCTALRNIVIPSNATTIGDSAFSYCSSLKTITLPNNLVTIGKSAFSSSGLENIVIPDKVTTIDNSAFSSCKKLESIVISDKVATIGNWVFSNCLALDNIVIPSSVNIIGDYTFNYWASTQTITVYGSDKTYGTSWSGGATVVYK